jgi:hypothetical protein
VAKAPPAFSCPDPPAIDFLCDISHQNEIALLARLLIIPGQTGAGAMRPALGETSAPGS